MATFFSKGASVEDVLRKPGGIFSRKTSFEKHVVNRLANSLIIRCLAERLNTVPDEEGTEIGEPAPSRRASPR